jgi:hypothetical protein
MGLDPPRSTMDSLTGPSNLQVQSSSAPSENGSLGGGSARKYHDLLTGPISGLDVPPPPPPRTERRHTKALAKRARGVWVYWGGSPRKEGNPSLSILGIGPRCGTANPAEVVYWKLRDSYISKQRRISTKNNFCGLLLLHTSVGASAAGGSGS